MHINGNHTYSTSGESPKRVLPEAVFVTQQK